MVISLEIMISLEMVMVISIEMVISPAQGSLSEVARAEQGALDV